ncbi:MAG: chemotaxis protein CheW [Oscillospiraceae bacterium]
MAKFEAGMENMVDMYIFETTSLLEQLDQILMKTENESSFGSEDINEIFRTMHTIKGSSSMMGLENMSHLAHAVEDMFFIIREDNPEITDKKTLFDLVFTASDLLKTEIELLQEEEYTPTDFSGHMSKIEAYAKALKEGGTAPAASAEAAPAPSVQAVPEGKTIKVISNSGESMTTVKIYFEDDCKMENLRALLVVNNIKSECAALTYEPSDIEDNSESSKTIIDNGFVIHFRPAADATQEAVIDIIGNSLNVKSYEVTDAAESGTKEVPVASLSEVKVTFVEDCKMENLRALMVINNIRESCELLAFSPEDIENDPSTAQTIIENGFTVYFKAAEDQAIVDMIKATPNVKDAVLVRKGGEAPTAGEKAAAKAAPEAAAPKAEEKPAAGAAANAAVSAAARAPEQKDAKKAAPAVSGGAKQSLISVNLNKLDQLLDIVGEIVITEAMVTSSPDLKVKGLKLDNFQKAARQLRKLNSELQETVMSIRMVPLSGAFNKMTRIVRDMKVKLNKDVDLVFEGEETEVDKSIIDNLNDPLMHMVRNSMDHGIEDTAEERVAKGKPAKGKITLSAYNSSGEVIICVTDDGQGINPEKVLDKAEKNGMLTKPRSEYTDKEIFNMIMLPGFSTNEEVTEYSGRGVGMDVVKKNIEKTGGTVSVDSKWGEGTQFTIKIPLSLSIVDGMEISVGQSIFTIPIGVIKESFKIKPNQLLKDTNGSEMVMIRGECYPLIRLYDVFDLKPSSTDINDGIIILVEVESEGKSACLLADELIGEQQVVVKPFSPMLNNFNVKENGMAGCSILGDGSITIILDIGNIISDF